MLFALLAAYAAPPPHVQQAREAVDWEAAGDEAARWLSEYIQIDTVNPPGNERDGAMWLGELLESEGIPTQIIEQGDNRASLIARLEGSTDQPPLCLLSHIDVVTSEADKWEVAPLSGEIRDGSVWGRGALDMKGMGIVEATAMIQLARTHTALKRDIVLLAVADEELGGMGIQDLAANHWDTIGCSHVINEGGLGLVDGLFEGQTVHAISVAEKGVLWARLVANGEPGHGSTIDEGEAPLALLEAMERVEERFRSKPHFDPSMREMLRRVGAHKGGLTGAILRSRVGVGLFVRPKLRSDSTTAAVITDTVHLTGMGGAGGSTNVVPSTSWASYDCRLLPGSDPLERFAELQALTEDLPGVHWELEDHTAANSSPWEDPLFDTIARYAVEDRPEAVAAPVLSPGFTDSIYLRPLGVRAYGYVPFELDRDQASTMHGNNERISLDNLRDGTRVLFSILVDFAGAN